MNTYECYGLLTFVHLVVDIGCHEVVGQLGRILCLLHVSEEGVELKGFPLHVFTEEQVFVFAFTSSGADFLHFIFSTR